MTISLILFVLIVPFSLVFAGISLLPMLVDGDPDANACVLWPE